ncbi:MAPEG family protein [Brevundimonas albigilva]|nr:MAPEG family protein [Brevundimonas albigilva]UQV17762.1 MAPEG family protein [Brevundimonas albigilva]
MMTEALMHALQAAALWSGLLILMLLVLSGMVVSGRRRHMVSFGDGGHSDLLAASRAFGNCVEYATPGMAAMALLAWSAARRGWSMRWARPCWRAASSMRWA